MALKNILLCLILCVSLVNWAEHSQWVAVRNRRVLKLRRRLGKKIKNWKHQRRTNG